MCSMPRLGWGRERRTYAIALLCNLLRAQRFDDSENVLPLRCCDAHNGTRRHTHTHRWGGTGTLTIEFLRNGVPVCRRYQPSSSRKTIIHAHTHEQTLPGRISYLSHCGAERAEQTPVFVGGKEHGLIFGIARTVH